MRGGSLHQVAQDCVEDAAKIFSQRVVPKPDRFDSEMSKQCFSLLVSGLVFGMTVFPAVQLDG